MNSLRTRFNSESIFPPRDPYEFEDKSLNMLIKDKPAETVLPLQQSNNFIRNTVQDQNLSDETAASTVSPNILTSMLKKPEQSAGELTPTTDGTITYPAQAYADTQAQDDASFNQPTNTLTTDYWKTSVAGTKMPLDKFVQLTGMAAHALDPKGFGGILGKDLANYATTERDVEQTNALRKLQMEHSELQNKELKEKLNPDSTYNTLRQLEIKTKRRELEEKDRRFAEQTISNIDIGQDPESHTRTVEKLKAAGIDTSLVPNVDVFKKEDGSYDVDGYNKWRDAYVSTAEQKAKMGYDERKEKVKTVTIYNEAARKTMDVTYVTDKNKPFDPAVIYGAGWSRITPNTTQARTPTAFSSFVEEANAKGWDAATRNAEWEKRRTKELQAKTPTAYSDFVKEAEANGWDIATRNKIWEERRHSQDAEGKVSKTSLVTAETTILLNASSDIKGAQPKAIAPQVNLFNTNTTGDYIYTSKTEDNRRYIGPWNVTGDQNVSWEKTTLPIVDGKQVTGKVIDATSKEKGMAFEAAYEGIKSGKVKPVWKEKGGATTSGGTALLPPETPPGTPANPTIPDVADLEKRLKTPGSKFVLNSEYVVGKTDGKRYSSKNIVDKYNAAVKAGANPVKLLQHISKEYGINLE